MNNPKDTKKNQDGMSMKGDHNTTKGAPKSKNDKTGASAPGKTTGKNKQEMSGR